MPSKPKNARNSERVQFEQKLVFERKIEESKMTSYRKTGGAKNTNLPKLVNGTHTDRLHFWAVFEAKKDSYSELAAVTKFAYLKELVDSKIRAGIDGLPFSTEGFERVKNVSRSKYGKMTS